jgi:hypothetical protein
VSIARDLRYLEDKEGISSGDLVWSSAEYSITMVVAFREIN